MNKYTLTEALDKIQDFREIVESVLDSAAEENEIAIIDKDKAVEHITTNLIAYGFWRHTDGIDPDSEDGYF